MPRSLPQLPNPRAREEDSLKKRAILSKKKKNPNNNNYVSRYRIEVVSFFGESAYVYKYIEKYTCVHNKQYKYTVSLFIYDI